MSTQTKDIILEEISEEISAMAEGISKKLVIDEDGTLTGEEDLYLSTLPKDLSIETVERVHEHDSAFATAFLMAGGDKAIEYRKSHTDAKRIAGVVRAGKNELAFNYNVPSRKADGSWKDPSVTVISRRYEHAEHGKVRSNIAAKTKSIMD